MSGLNIQKEYGKLLKKEKDNRLKIKLGLMSEDQYAKVTHTGRSSEHHGSDDEGKRNGSMDSECCDQNLGDRIP